MKKNLVIAAALLCVGIFAITGCAAGSPQVIESGAPQAASASLSAEEKQENESTLTLSATETVKVAPDVAYIFIGVKTTGNSAEQAQQENARITDAFLKAVEEQGVLKDDMQTQNINVYQDYDDAKKTVMENTYKITVKDVGSVGAVIDAATGAGANYTYSLTFDIQDRDTVYMQALSKAMESVGTKAKAMAMAGGYTITRPLSITESGADSGVMPYRESGFYDTASAEGSAETQVTPQEIEVSATVSGTYLIQ